MTVFAFNNGNYKICSAFSGFPPINEHDFTKGTQGT